MKKREVLIIMFLVLTLCAVAVSNVFDMEISAKVAQAKTDLHSIGLALESYKSNNGKYPPDGMFYSGVQNSLNSPTIILFRLTTPIAYLASLPQEVFPSTATLNLRRLQYGYGAEQFINSKRSYPLGSKNPEHYWSVASLGPDRIDNWGVWSAIHGIDGIDFLPPLFNIGWGCIYDPTNGTVSSGDIVEVSAERVTKARDWQNY